MVNLGLEALDFLSKHGLRDASDKTEWSSPDAGLLEVVALRLSEGKSIKGMRLWSDWSSGGYGPYSDKEARAWHDSLISKISKLI